MIEKPHRPGIPAWRDLLRAGLAALLLLAAGGALARGPWRASEDNTRGWQLMSPEERIEHQARVRGFRDYETCHAYRLEHHRQMAERARQKGVQLKPGHRDICEHLLPAAGSRAQE